MSSALSTEQLAAIRAREAAANPGPWAAEDDGLVWGQGPGDPVSGSAQLADAEFIAHARQDIPDLLAELDEMRALFDMQWRRMGDATDRWRAEDPAARNLVMPDLGALLRWLMDDADKARAGAARVLQLCDLADHGQALKSGFALAQGALGTGDIRKALGEAVTGA